MRQIDRDYAQSILNDHIQAGFKVDDRLLTEIMREGQLYVFCVEDEATFLSLIWQETDDARLFTPKGAPRTLRDVAERLIQKDCTFESLTKNMVSGGQYRPEWFETCVQIDAAFDFKKFGWIAVVAPTDDERRQSPHGSFYIFDGTHKALVLAKRLLKKETTFKAIKALYLVPRRS